MKQENKHFIHIEYGDIDFDHCTARAKVTRDGVEYSAFYDTCNLILRDKNGKIAHLDDAIEECIASDLDEYLGV